MQLVEILAGDKFANAVYQLRLMSATEKNVCALPIDLAKQNNMKLSELFSKYLGG